jgi:hypothetical protein
MLIAIHATKDSQCANSTSMVLGWLEIGLVVEAFVGCTFLFMALA